MSTSISTYVQATADVVRVVSLKPGDVYKRLNEGYGEPKMSLGIVTAVLNNGERTAITAVEYEATYTGVDAKAKTFTDKTDVAIFPAHPDEITSHVSDLLRTAHNAVARAERDLHDRREALTQAERVVEMFEAKSLTAAATEAVSA